MSYESMLYVVVKSSYIDTNYPRFCFQIAQYDLSRLPAIADLFDKGNPKSNFTDCGLFLGCNGDKQVTEDLYGDKLREASLQAVIDILRSPEVQSKNYQRVPPLLAMLEMFCKMQNKFKDLVVIHFGH